MNVPYVNASFRPQSGTKPRACKGRLWGLMGLAFIGCLSFTKNGQAQQSSNRDAVVELYTSQGCKSCPAADEILAKSADDPNILALSFNVNYWDYLGWRDTLATQENTDRQHAYRDSFAKMVYTPQMIVNGSVQMNGGEATEIAKHLEGTKLDVPIAIHRSDEGRLSIDVAAGEKPQSPVHVVIFYIRDSVSTPITKGENAGKSVTYRNTVADIDTIGLWDGKTVTFELPASKLDSKNVTGFAVILQEFREKNSLGPILGAALFREATAEP